MFTTGTGADGGVLCLPSGRCQVAGAARGIIALHGATDTGVSNCMPGGAGQPTIAKLADHCGCPVISADLSGNLAWANDATMTAITAVWTLLKATSGTGAGLAKTDKVVLVGISMGGLAAINWAQRNPTLVKAMALVVPVINFTDLYNNNRGGYAAGIKTAYGGVDPVMSTHDPLLMESSMATDAIPTKLYYVDGDVLINVTTADNTAYAAAVGSSVVTEKIGSGLTHVQGYQQVDPNDIVSFLSPYL